MRILHCIANMNLGGAERQLAYLCKGLRDLDQDPHVLLGSRGLLFRLLEKTGTPIHVLKESNNHSPLILTQIWKTIKTTKPDIVQTWLRQMDVAAGIVSLSSGVPWIISERSSESMYPQTLKHRLRIALGKRAKAIVSNSEGGKGYWQKVTNGSAKCYIVPNAVPIDSIDSTIPLDSSIGAIQRGLPIVLFAGRLSEEKNVSGFLQAIQEARNKVPLTAVICGDGPERKSVENCANSLGIQDDVVLMGNVNNVWSWMKSAAVFVSVSKVEGNPNAVLEAMACRCPIVLSDIPAHREICSNSMATFVHLESPVSTAEAIIRILVDNKSASQQVTESRAYAERTSTIAMAKRYLSIYSLLTSS